MERTKKACKGPADRVPCPHCGRPNDFSELYDVERGAVYSCDHCDLLMRVVRVDRQPRIVVQQYNRERPDEFEARPVSCADAECAAQPVTQIGCELCEFVVHHCAEHDAIARRSLQAHLKLEHRRTK